MQRTSIWYVFALLSFVFAIGCDRQASNKTSVTLQIPKELQEKMAATDATSTLRLVHLALQISGPGLDKVYTNILDTHDDNSSLPAEISIAEIPAGDNRVIQVLAAYAAPHSDSASIYYGDVTQALKNATENVPVSISKLGGSGASTMARITGRYLTSASSGPTGELQMMYRPAGKPAMAVDKKSILNGWFEVSTFQDVPVDYVLMKDGVLTDTVIGSQWTNASFSPSTQVVRVTSPAGYRANWNGAMTPTFEAREAQIQIVGFFAANSSFLSDKKICVSSVTNKNAGTVHYSGALISQDEDTARPLKHFPMGTTATVSNDFVIIEGGQARSTCGTLAPEDEFNKYLWFLPDSLSGGYAFSQDLTRTFGLNEAFVGTQALSNYNDSMNRTFYSSVRYSSALGLHYKFPVLPGLESVIDGVKIYKRLSNMATATDDRCDRIDPSLYSLSSTMAPQFSGSNLIVKLSDLAISNGEFVVCMAVKDKPVGRFAYAGVWGPYAPSDLLNIYNANPNGTAHQGECQRVNVQLGVTTALDANNQPISRTPYPDRSSYTFTINTDYSGTSAAVLYTDSACSGTATSSVTATMNSPDDTKAFFFKPSNTETITFTLTGLPSGMTSTPYNLTVSDQSGSMTRLTLETDSEMTSYENGNMMRAFPNGCFPLKAVPKSSNDSVKYTGTVTVSLLDIDNSPISPAQIRFYPSCSSTTEISGGVLSFSNESSKSFVMKTTTLIKNVKLKLYASGFSSFTTINPIPQAYQLAVALPSSASSGQCVPITVKSQDSAGVDKALLRSANFNISSPNNGMSFFSSGSCTGTSLSSFAFAPGTSQYTVYAKLIAAGSLDLQINGDSVDFNIPYLSKNMVVTPGPLSINATPISGSILANNSAQFLITGGKPPFTIQGSHANIQGSNINSSAEGYVLNLTFGVSAIGATSLGILDSMGATTTLNITIAP